MATTRLDLEAAVDRFMFVAGQGHLLGLPTRPGSSSAVTTGVPTNGIAGFAPGAIFPNFKGGPGSALYVNIGTNLSAQWVNIDSENSGVVSLTAATTLSALLHGGKNMLLSLLGGFTTTLPAATGTGQRYQFTVNIVSTTGYVVAAAGSDVFKGSIWNVAPGATPGTGATFVSSANQNITLNGTTKGGLSIGDTFTIQDVASGVWNVLGFVTGSGTLATPFS